MPHEKKKCYRQQQKKMNQTRKARRHMQRAQELMGFGSESQFGVNIHDMPAAQMFKHMDNQTLFKTMLSNKKMNENVKLYLRTEEGNNERLKEALLKKDERMVEILIENGLLVPQK